MKHCNRMLPFALGAALVGATLAAAGVPLGALLPFAVFLVCPLMMAVMMWSMGAMHGRSGDDHSHSEGQLKGRPDDSVRRTEQSYANTPRG